MNDFSKNIFELMAESGLDAIVSWQPSTFRYLTGVAPRPSASVKEFMVVAGGGNAPAEKAMVILPAKAPPIAVVPPLWTARVAEYVQDVRAATSSRSPSKGAGGQNSAPSPNDQLRTILRECGLNNARIGIERQLAAAEEMQAIERDLPRVEWRDCTILLRIARARKSPIELRMLESAASIAESAAARVIETAGRDTTINELVRDYRLALAEADADIDHFFVAPHAVGFLDQGTKPLGSVTSYLDFGCRYRDWYSDSGTTFCTDQPTEDVREGHARAFRITSAGVEAIAPGVRGSVLADAMRDEARREAGAASSGYSWHRGLSPHGHGLGLEAREYPLILPHSDARLADDCIEVSADMELSENMVINLEAPLFRSDTLTFHCERTVVVTRTGCRPLVPQDRENPWTTGS